MAEPLTPEQRWALLKRAAQPEAPVAWLLEKLGQGAANIKQAVTEPAEFHRRALTNLATQIQQDPVEFAMNWTGGGLGGVIKPKGGNWLAGQVERAVAPLKTPDIVDETRRLGFPVNEQAASQVQSINKWLEGKLTKYIKNEMATPEDPLRLAADKWEQVAKPKLLAENAARLEKAQADMARAQAERGVTPEMLTSSRARILELEKERDYLNARTGLHFSILPTQRSLMTETKWNRELAGFPREGMGTTELGKRWEDLADKYLEGSGQAGQMLKPGYWLRDADAARIQAENPWLSKVPPETPVYRPNAGVSSRDTGFKHMVDELNNAMNPESGLPKELQITAKDLDKMNVEQVADLVDRINAHRAVQKAEANKLAAQKSIEVYKEYPESEKGLRWVEMKTTSPAELPEGYEVITSPSGSALWGPDGKRITTFDLDSPVPVRDQALQFLSKKDLEAALKYEGDVMGHCVGGYCPDVIEGRSRIFSLRDAKGQPYATVEVKTTPSAGSAEEAEVLGKLENAMRDAGLSEKQLDDALMPYINEGRVPEKYKSFYDQVLPKDQLYIEQIKGPGNRKPADEVMPYVQDFVKSQPWSRVEDLQNTGLYRVTQGQRLPGFSKEIEPGLYSLEDFQKMAAENDMPQEILDSWMSKLKSRNGMSHGGAVGMAAGGVVEFDPDKIDRIAADFWSEQTAGERIAAERRPAPTMPEGLELREGATSVRPVKAREGYNARFAADVAPGVQPFADVDPWRRLIAQYGVQYAQPLPGGAASAELAFDPATNARILSGAYRQRLSDDSELSARGAYIAGGEKPSYNIGVEYRRRFATGGSVTAYDSGKIQGLADALREEMYA